MELHNNDCSSLKRGDDIESESEKKNKIEMFLADVKGDRELRN